MSNSRAKGLKWFYEIHGATIMIRQFSMTVQKTDNSIVRRDDCLSRHTLPTNVLDSVIFALCHSHPSYISPPARMYFVTGTLFTALFDLSHWRTHCYDKHNDGVAELCYVINKKLREEINDTHLPSNAPNPNGEDSS